MTQTEPFVSVVGDHQQTDSATKSLDIDGIAAEIPGAADKGPHAEDEVDPILLRGHSDPTTVVLIVEDDLFNLELAEMLIQEFGYRTLAVSSAGEALSALSSSQPVDLLFTDMNLKTGVLGGCDLAHAAVKLRPDLRVLYATGNIVTDKIKDMLVDGSLLLAKPYTQSQLQASLKNLLLA